MNARGWAITQKVCLECEGAGLHEGAGLECEGRGYTKGGLKTQERVNVCVPG